MKSSKDDYFGDPPAYAEPYLPGTVPQHPAPPLQPHYQPVFLNPQSEFSIKKKKIALFYIFLSIVVM